jgi:murein DD-endopeptidase MepM/ murein hydrolase activator NlpD
MILTLLPALTAVGLPAPRPVHVVPAPLKSVLEPVDPPSEPGNPLPVHPDRPPARPALHAATITDPAGLQPFTTSIESPVTAQPFLRTQVGQWQWPLHPPPAVARFFAVGPEPWSPGHRGVDLLAAAGATVHAPAAGRLSYAGIVAGRPVLSLDHGGGIISSFEPVETNRPVGSVVAAGDVIGRMAGGPSHCSPGWCLHWGVRSGGRYVNPLLFLAAFRGPVVLLPLLGPAPVPF